MEENTDIQKIIDQYERLGQIITHESSKLKNKLQPNGLDSTDLETLSEQFTSWMQLLEGMSGNLQEIMTCKGNSI